MIFCKVQPQTAKPGYWHKEKFFWRIAPTTQNLVNFYCQALQKGPAGMPAVPFPQELALGIKNTCSFCACAFNTRKRVI